MRTEPNEPISSIVEQNNYEGNFVMEAKFNGLSKREHFAGLVMQGICANPQQCALSHMEIAEYSVEIADALIHALNKNAK